MKRWWISRTLFGSKGIARLSNVEIQVEIVGNLGEGSGNRKHKSDFELIPGFPSP